MLDVSNIRCFKSYVTKERTEVVSINKTLKKYYIRTVSFPSSFYMCG